VTVPQQSLVPPPPKTTARFLTGNILRYAAGWGLDDSGRKTGEASFSATIRSIAIGKGALSTPGGVNLAFQGGAMGWRKRYDTNAIPVGGLLILRRRLGGRRGERLGVGGVGGEVIVGAPEKIERPKRGTLETTRCQYSGD